MREGFIQMFFCDGTGNGGKIWNGLGNLVEASGTVGGIARIAHEINRIRAEKEAAGEPVLTQDAGDFSQGTIFSWLETETGGHAEPF